MTRPRLPYGHIAYRHGREQFIPCFETANSFRRIVTDLPSNSIEPLHETEPDPSIVSQAKD
jgi:hypothetical protein